jgi:CHAT domain-containing protein
LKEVKKLYISADSVLYTLPFEALVDGYDQKAFRDARKAGGRGEIPKLGEYNTLHYVVDSYTITYLPSATVLRSLRKYEKPGYGKWDKSLIAFADPIFNHHTGEVLLRLKESSEEANAVASEVKGKKEDIYMREKATEDNVYKANLKDARYILFSTHCLLGGDFPGVGEPALALTLIDNPPGRDGFLTMSKVLELELNAEMVVLSGCNDKSGRLTRSFMYAGAKSILVAHWSMESQAASDLVVGMFRDMKKETRPEALREAKLKMKSSTRQMGKENLSLSHPFYWAPFVIVGEGE